LPGALSAVPRLRGPRNRVNTDQEDVSANQESGHLAEWHVNMAACSGL